MHRIETIRKSKLTATHGEEVTKLLKIVIELLNALHGTVAAVDGY